MPTLTDTAVALTQSLSLDLTKLAPLRPFIFGPQAGLHRYGVSTEKPIISLGNLAFGSQQAFPWPGRGDASVIDLSHTDVKYPQVFLDNCLLNYLNGAAGAPVANYSNEVRTAAVVLQTANGSNRAAALLDRDVQIGDTVRITGTSASTVAGALQTTVTGLVADITASSTTAATADAGNKTTQVGSGTASQTNGTPFNEVVVVANYAAYSSLADGYITRSYLVTVTQGSVGGDATTARLSVVSTDGLDNVPSVTPAVFTSPTNIGTKGGTATFSINTGHYSGATGYALADFVVGQQWLITFSQAFTAPVATGGGTYSGPSDTTYKITVSRGGLYAGATPPQILVSTLTGLPGSGPTNITAAATAVSIGAYTPAVTVAFSQTGLCKGDTYYIACTAAKPGPVKTLALQNSLTTALASDGVTLVDLTTATTLAVSLFIKQQSSNLPMLTSYPVPGNNWTATQSYLTINANLYTYDPSWTSGGVQRPIAISSADTYVQYREWLQSDGAVHALTRLNQISAIFGPVDPDNPISYACQEALLNTPGNLLVSTGIDTSAVDTVYATALIGDPAVLEHWTIALNQAAQRDDAYNIVPLSTDPNVQASVINHVVSQSVPTTGGFFRGCFLASSVNTATAIVSSATTTNGNTAMATLMQDPTTVAASFTQLQVSAGNAQFITNGVQAGDQVRYLYGTSPGGGDSYNTYTVASVISQDSLRLLTGSATAVTVPQRVEVWRITDVAEAKQQLIAGAAIWPSDRICYVWPDSTSLAGVDQQGYYLCASLAALAGAIPSQRSMRNLIIQGHDAAPRANGFMGPGDLHDLSQAGVFAVTGDLSGHVYVYWPATTDPTSVDTKEESIRRNADMVRFAIMDTWGAVIGQANATGTVLQAMRTSLADLTSQLVTVGNSGSLGPPVYSLTLDSLIVDPVVPDQIDANVTMIGPTPVNVVSLVLILGQ